jgi:GNAT superfamily N-acetyltransferase
VLHIEGWLANKTIASWERWIAREDAFVLVADREGAVVGVGMATFQGEILLNDVHPEARFAGVSTALLTAMEAELMALKLRHCRVESTITARSFYKGRGYREEPGNPATLAKSL